MSKNKNKNPNFNSIPSVEAPAMPDEVVNNTIETTEELPADEAATVEPVETEDETPDAEAEAPAEEVTEEKEVPVDECPPVPEANQEEETPVEGESIPTTTDENPENEDPENPEPPVVGNQQDVEDPEQEAPAPTAEAAPTQEVTDESDKEADPLPELEGKIYIKIGEGFDDKKLAVIDERLDKTGLTHTVTAKGEVLVGSFTTEEEAIKAKKLIIGKGLKGTIITVE